MSAVPPDIVGKNDITARQARDADVSGDDAWEDSSIEPPLGLLAELTHRCPMGCLYCSNPLELAPPGSELPTTAWKRIFAEAVDLGVMQLHLSGGEPALRPDLESLVRAAARAGLYGNLITSGLGLDGERLARLADAGLEHVQLSLQDSASDVGEQIGGLRNAHAHKLALAPHVVAAGLALTLNVVLHRHNLSRLEEIIDLAVALGAQRLELAHTQYHGWALLNRAALLPRRVQVDAAFRTVALAQRRLKGVLVIDHVVPDMHAILPKMCMGGWGRRFLVIDPTGRVLPCHAATTIPGLEFENARDRSLGDIWYHSEAFARFRGTGWMRSPCAQCEHREEDWGGCRCQALALTGDAANTDPVCYHSPHHRIVQQLAESGEPFNGELVYRAPHGGRRIELASAQATWDEAED